MSTTINRGIGGASGGPARVALDSNALENTFAKLNKVSKNSHKTAKRMVRNKDAIQGLLTSLNDNPKFSKMIEYSVECLKKMAVDEVCVEELIEEGVLETLMKIQKLNPYNESVNRMINECIAAFCLNDRLAKMIADRIGTGNFLFSLKKHVEPETVSASCHAMARMMRVDVNVDLFVEANCIEALDHVAAQMHHEPEVMASVAECLQCISRNPAHIPALLQTNLIQNLLLSLKNFPDNANLVQRTLGFLANIGSVDGAHLKLLKDLGVVDLIVAALEMNADNVGILKMGADALRYLADGNDLSNALRCKIGLTDETANALAKLSSLMLVEDNIALMIDQQGIQWLIEALNTAAKAPPSEISLKILVSGCRALNRICVDEKKIYAVMQANGVNTLMAIVASHGKDENVLVAALQALARMVTRKENAEFLLRCGLLAAVDTARKTHPTSNKVAVVCSDIFERASKHTSVHKALLDGGVIGMLKDLMTTFMDDIEIVQHCLNALANLAVTQEAIQAMIDAGIPQLISQLLEKYPDNEELVKKAIELFTNMANNHSNGAELLRNAGITKAILAALDALASNTLVQSLGSDLMKLLAGETQLKEAVGNVWSTSQHMIKNPTVAGQFTTRLGDGVALLKNLCLVEANYAKLTQHNAQASLAAAIQAAIPLEESALRTQILTDAMQGLERLTALGDAPIAKQVVKSGALFALLAAIQKNPSDENLAETAMRGVALCAQYPQNSAELISGNVIPAVVGISKVFPYNESIQASAAATLGVLCSDPAAAAQMVQAGGASTILDTLSTNIDNIDELLKALDILRKIALDPSISDALWKAGALDAIIAIWRKHVACPPVVEACLQALITMLVTEEIAIEMGEKGVCELGIPAIRSHYRHVMMVEADVILLDSLASSRANAERLLHVDLATVELMYWVIKKYKDRPDTVAAAERLIATLLGVQQELDQAKIQADIARMSLDDDSVQAMFKDLLNEKRPDEFQSMFQKLEMLMTNPEVIKTLAKNGGLNSMSQLLLNQAHNEDVMKPAAAILLRMCGDFDDDEILELLENPMCANALCEIYKPHPNYKEPVSDEMVKKTVKGLGSMELNDPAVNQMIDNGGLSNLTKLMTTSNDPDMIREAARVLGKASNCDSAIDAMAQNMLTGTNGFSTIRELIDAMRKHILNIDFIRFGLYLLGNLAVTDAIKDEIGIQSGVQLIIQICQTHPTEVHLVKNSVYALATLTFNHAINCAFVMACKGIPLTMKIMVDFKSSAELLDSAVCILCNLCHNNDSNKTLIINEGGAVVLVDTVLNNFDQVEVLLTAFKTLFILAYNSHAVDAIIKAGGVQGIVAGMTVLADNIQVVDIAMSVLTNLASNCTEEHMRIMAEEGAVQAIVEVAAAHTTNVDIELSSVRALCNLAVMHYNADLIIKQGGCEVVISALASLGYDAEFVETAIRLLFNLTYSINNLNRMIKAGVARSVLLALRNQLTSLRVISIGLRCISNLCYSDEVSITIASEGPIEFIIQLIQANMARITPETPAIIGESMTALSALCRSETNALSMAAQTTTLCARVLAMMSMDPSLIQNVSRYLANLFVHGPAAIAAVDTNIVPQLLSTISMHINNVEVLLVACKPLENVAYGSQGVRDYMKQQLVIEKMTEVINSNADREDVRNAANAVIYAVNRTDFVSDNLDFIELNRSRRNLKDVYDALGEKREVIEDVLHELPPKVKNFLTAGGLLMKHSKTAKPRYRHVYITDDLKWFVWKDPKVAAVDPEQRMKIFKIRTVEIGRCTAQLQRQNFGKYYADEKCCFSIQGRERTVDVEASSEKEREKWVKAIEQLIAYRKGLQTLQAKSAQFH